MGRGRSQGTPIACDRCFVVDADGQLVAEARAIAARLLGESAATLDLNPSMDRGELSATIAAVREQGGMNLVLASHPGARVPGLGSPPRPRRSTGFSVPDGWSRSWPSGSISSSGHPNFPVDGRLAGVPVRVSQAEAAGRTRWPPQWIRADYRRLTVFATARSPLQFVVL